MCIGVRVYILHYYYVYLRTSSNERIFLQISAIPSGPGFKLNTSVPIIIGTIPFNDIAARWTQDDYQGEYIHQPFGYNY